MKLEELCEYLAARCPSTFVTVVGELPSLTTEGVAIHIPGFAPQAEFFGVSFDDILKSDTTLWKPLVRFAIRSKLYTTGQTWATEIRETFHKYEAREDGLLAMIQVGTVRYLGRNAEGYHEAQVTYTTQIRSE